MCSFCAPSRRVRASETSGALGEQCLLQQDSLAGQGKSQLRRRSNALIFLIFLIFTSSTAAMISQRSTSGIVCASGTLASPSSPRQFRLRLRRRPPPRHAAPVRGRFRPPSFLAGPLAPVVRVADQTAVVEAREHAASVVVVVRRVRPERVVARERDLVGEGGARPAHEPLRADAERAVDDRVAEERVLDGAGRRTRPCNSTKRLPPRPARPRGASSLVALVV